MKPLWTVIPLLFFSLSFSCPAGEKETETEKAFYVEIITLKIDYVRKLKEKDAIIESLKTEIAEKDKKLEESSRNIDILTREMNNLISESNSLLGDNDLPSLGTFYHSSNVSRFVKEIVYGCYRAGGFQ